MLRASVQRAGAGSAGVAWFCNKCCCVCCEQPQPPRPRFSDLSLSLPTPFSSVPHPAPPVSLSPFLLNHTRPPTGRRGKERRPVPGQHVGPSWPWLHSLFSSLIHVRTLSTLFTHHARTPFSTASVQVRHRPPPRPAYDSEQAGIAASRRASSCPPRSCSPSLPPYRKHANHTKISPPPFHFISSPDTHDTPNTLTTPSIPSPPTP